MAPALILRKLLPTLVLCLLAGLLCGMPLGGFLLYLAVPLAAVVLALSGIRAWRRPAERPWRGGARGWSW